MNQEIITLFLQIFILIALGYFFAKLKFFTNDIKQALSSFLLNCILPISIINSSQLEYSSTYFKGFLTCAVVGFVYITAILLIVPKLLTRFKVAPDKARVSAMMLAFSNSAFMGFAIAQELYGEQGLLYSVGYNISFNLILFSLGISLMSGEKNFEWKSFFHKMMTTPAMIAAILGLILYLLPFRFPGFIKDAFASASAIMMPASMLIIGCELAMIKFRKIISSVASLIISVFRLIVMPLLTALILKLLNVDPTVIAVCAMLNAMPAGATNVILATQYNCKPEYTTIATTQTMLWMIIVTPFVINFINNLVF